MSQKIQINDTYRQLYGDNLTLRDDVRYFDVYGGRRSAKSFEVMQVLGITALKEEGHFIPCIRKVGATLKDSVFAEVVGFFRRNNIPVRVNKTEKEVEVIRNGNRFRCFGLDDAEKLKSLKDATIMWIEEANEITEEDFNSIDAGLSPGNHKGRILLTHNPIAQIPGSMHWIQKRFLTGSHKLSEAKIDEGKNALILRTWYKDNVFCPEETIKVLEGYKDTNPTLYKMWALGEFAHLEGLVFNNWDVVSEVPEEILHDSIGIGLDFGFSVDPSAAVRLWVHDKDIYVQQLVYKTDLHNEQLYKELKDAGVTDYEPVIGDSSRPDIITDLHRKGLRGIRGVKKKANYKEDVATRLQSFNLHVVEPSIDLQRELSMYAWARDKNGKQLPKLQDGNDHGIDAIIMRIHDYHGSQDMRVSEFSLSEMGL